MAVINYSTSVGIIGLNFVGEIYSVDHIASRLYTSVRKLCSIL